MLIGIGLYVRLRVLESPEFTAVRKEEKVVKLPVLQVITEQPREVLTSAFVRLSEQAPFYIFITFVLTYGTEKLKFEKGDLLNDVLIAATVGLVCVPLFGFLSDIIGRRTMYGIGIVCMGLFAFPYYGLLNTQRSGLVLLAIVAVAGLPRHAVRTAGRADLGELRHQRPILRRRPRLPDGLGHRRRSGAADRREDPREDRTRASASAGTSSGAASSP